MAQSPQLATVITPPNKEAFYAQRRAFQQFLQSVVTITTEQQQIACKPESKFLQVNFKIFN